MFLGQAIYVLGPLQVGALMSYVTALWCAKEKGV
jgi:hypothetical protein